MRDPRLVALDAAFRDLADPEHAAFHQAYHKSALPFLGLAAGLVIDVQGETLHLVLEVHDVGGLLRPGAGQRQPQEDEGGEAACEKTVQKSLMVAFHDLVPDRAS